MTTWANLLADIRTDLKDTNATPRWSDATLFLYVKDAIRTYSLYFPLRMDQAVLVAANGAYPLPADFISDVAVECPENVFLERRLSRPGRRYPTQYRPLFYWIAGSRLYINGSPNGDDVLLTYNARHPLPANSEDAAFELTLPELDEELIRIYVKAKANEQVRGQQSNLDRFKPGTGDRTDNPLAPEVADLMQDFYAKIAERTTGGTINLYRPGRSR
jgi:hypothetical protein